MKTIETTAVVGPDRQIVVQAPPDITLGAHRVVIVIDEATTKNSPSASITDLPLHYSGLVPADRSLRREDLYENDGR